jgi:glycosyltransferase 2 family protein
MTEPPPGPAVSDLPSTSGLADRRSSLATLAEVGRLHLADLVIAAVIAAGLVLLAENADLITEVRTEMAGADWWWIGLALVLSLLTAFTGALSMTGAFEADVPFGRVVVLQTARWFAQLVSGTVGAAATIIRFGQRRGLGSAVALSAGLLVSVTGFAVQVVLMLVCLPIAGSAMDLSVPTSSDGPPAWVFVVIALVAAVGGLLLAVPRFRHRVTDRVRAPYEGVRDNMRAISRRPRKLFRLFGGLLLTNVLYTLGLAACLQAYGQSLPLATVLLVNTGSMFIMGLAPVPGGVGVTEAALVAGLTAAGIPSGPATAATVSYRMVSAYLPPAGGWLGLIWLRRHDDL